jgi:hypothetical protein
MDRVLCFVGDRPDYGRAVGMFFDGQFLLTKTKLLAKMTGRTPRSFNDHFARVGAEAVSVPLAERVRVVRAQFPEACVRNWSLRRLPRALEARHSRGVLDLTLVCPLAFPAAVQRKVEAGFSQEVDLVHEEPWAREPQCLTSPLQVPAWGFAWALAGPAGPVEC